MKTFNTAQEAHKYSTNNPSETVECKSYHDNGQIYFHCFYVDGKRHGESKKYYQNGNISVHCFYVNGLEHGEYKLFCGSGRLYEHIFYINSKTYNVDHLKDRSYKSRCILITLFDGNLIDEEI